MLTASFLLTALVITLTVGTALSVWLWSVRRRKLVIAGGLQTLAAMRWREFSQFVIEALQEQGFEASRISADAHRAAPADLQLTRNDETWLLSCKQGVNSRITVAMVDELAKSLHITAASGGILVTLGSIQTEARGHHRNVELIDGATLWPLIDPQLPPSVHAELAARARAKTVGATVLAWGAALGLGIAGAIALQLLLPGDSASPTPAADPPSAQTSSATTAVAAADAPSAPEPPVLDEAAQREAVVNGVAVLPGVERVGWVTDSTLLVQLLDESSERLDAGICATLAQFPELRASRVQLQPPEGSGTPVRFMQCSLY